MRNTTLLPRCPVRCNGCSPSLCTHGPPLVALLPAVLKRLVPFPTSHVSYAALPARNKQTNETQTRQCLLPVVPQVVACFLVLLVLTRPFLVSPCSSSSCLSCSLSLCVTPGLRESLYHFNVPVLGSLHLKSRPIAAKTPGCTHPTSTPYNLLRDSEHLRNRRIRTRENSGIRTQI